MARPVSVIEITETELSNRTLAGLNSPTTAQRDSLSVQKASTAGWPTNSASARPVKANGQFEREGLVLRTEKDEADRPHPRVETSHHPGHPAPPSAPAMDARMAIGISPDQPDIWRANDMGAFQFRQTAREVLGS